MISATLRSFGARLAVAAALSLYLGGARAEETKVTIDNFTFAPAELKVKVGDTVTWTNHDDIPHTVVSAGKFSSKAHGYRRHLLVHVHGRRRLQVFLFAAPAHDRDDQG